MRNNIFGFCRILSGFFFLVLLLTGFPSRATDSSKVVIVIDPGHGGENEGTKEGAYLEKDMDLYTALKVKEYLSDYDWIQVYLTRETDRDVSFRERAEFAKAVNADYLISLHYNASVNHDLFGSEVWISSQLEANRKCYQIASFFLKEFEEKGLFNRGIKVKLNDNNQDYYAIIRETAKYDIPAMIVEHCHVDEERDAGFCDTYDKLDHFAYADACAILKALNEEHPGFNNIAEEDVSAPDVCEIELSALDFDTAKASLKLYAADFDSCLLYYDYCIDGSNFSKRMPWPDTNPITMNSADVITLDIELLKNKTRSICFRVYNLYDIPTESNVLTVSWPHEEEVSQPVVAIPETEEELYSNSPENESLGESEEIHLDLGNRPIIAFFFICIASIIAILCVATLFLIKKNHTPRRRK